MCLCSVACDTAPAPPAPPRDVNTSIAKLLLLLRTVSIPPTLLLLLLLLLLLEVSVLLSCEHHRSRGHSYCSLPVLVSSCIVLLPVRMLPFPCATSRSSWSLGRDVRGCDEISLSSLSVSLVSVIPSIHNLIVRLRSSTFPVW